MKFDEWLEILQVLFAAILGIIFVALLFSGTPNRECEIRFLHCQMSKNATNNQCEMNRKMCEGAKNE